VKVGRISDETGMVELLNTVYNGTDTNGNLVFRGESPNGSSLFDLLTAEATATMQKEHPNMTYVPVAKSAIFSVFSCLPTPKRIQRTILL